MGKNARCFGQDLMRGENAKFNLGRRQAGRQAGSLTIQASEF
jgi:hypothetical protein